MSAPVVFVDTETTGLDPDRHEIWEVGIIYRAGDEWLEWSCFLPVDLGRADARGLAIGRYHERCGPEAPREDPRAAAAIIADLTRGMHIVGAVPSFDEERLRKLLRANGECPEWHYHLVDVENLVAGKLSIEPPWDSDELSAAAEVDVPTDERHTALGDARWAKRMYDWVMFAPAKSEEP